eukprot:m.174631 g.174631  ORF g.174631 m.174631 type:complete len:528 (+) comp17331_c0_seq1:470-2053(+)
MATANVFASRLASAASGPTAPSSGASATGGSATANGSTNNGAPTGSAAPAPSSTTTQGPVLMPGSTFSIPLPAIGRLATSPALRTPDFLSTVLQTQPTINTPNAAVWKTDAYTLSILTPELSSFLELTAAAAAAAPVPTPPPVRERNVFAQTLQFGKRPGEQPPAPGAPQQQQQQPPQAQDANRPRNNSAPGSGAQISGPGGSGASLATSTTSGSSSGLLDGENDRSFIVKFLQKHTCYDMMPSNGKIVVFDTQLLVKKAFFALVQHGIRSAPLWDSRRQQFVGMITITDFIHILRHYYVSPLVAMEELEEKKIQEWRDLFKKANSPDTLLCIDPMASLYEGVRMLIDHKIHRLPVINSRSGNALNILTHKRIILFMHLNMPCFNGGPVPAFLMRTIGDLNIGTQKNVAYVTHDTPLIVALNIFSERRVSALPIVNGEGVVVDIYAKFDAINLARERTYNNLDVTVFHALKHRTDFEGVQTCRLTDTLLHIINKIARAQIHRLVVVDDKQRLIGILSLSDILKCLTN